LGFRAVVEMVAHKLQSKRGSEAHQIVCA
jgi:hypothetical protein